MAGIVAIFQKADCINVRQIPATILRKCNSLDFACPAAFCFYPKILFFKERIYPDSTSLCRRNTGCSRIIFCRARALLSKKYARPNAPA